MNAWFDEDDVDFDEFRSIVEQRTAIAAYPNAVDLVSEVLVYRAQPGSKELEAEWNRALGEGPGIIVIKGAYADASVVDAATSVYEAIIEAESANAEKGDHFGAPGANARIWNSLEKLAIASPDTFVKYFANDTIATASRAWLGPKYQLTAQVNLVYPGGAAQQPHRDYHLGFQTNEEAAQYPRQAHLLSPSLTLQGAVAHCDMPVESGPTMLLPHSQKYGPGYLAWRDPQFIEYFENHKVQLPLEKGDVIFFNPAVFHGAGENRSANVQRMANLLQVSSAFGRAMESIDRARMCAAIFEPLKAASNRPNWSATDTANVIAACAEGYAFPTNLDRDQPMYGLAPASQAELLTEAVSNSWSSSVFAQALEDWQSRRRTQ